MINRKQVNLDTKVNLVAWLNINDPDMSIDDAIEKAEASGNTVIEVDEANRKLKAIDTQMWVEEDLWVCDHCGAYSKDKAKVEAHELICKEGS